MSSFTLQEVKTKIKIKGLKIDENKINSISLKLKYDDEIFEVVSVENLNGWTSQYTAETNRITLIKELEDIKTSVSKVHYINANTNVSIICPIHGEFE